MIAAERVTSRALREDDHDRMRRLFWRLSPETRYRRFFSPVMKVDAKLLDHLVRVDHHDREAFVALVDDEIIGVGRWDRLAGDPTAAEVAVVVEDAWQGQGVGRFLMQRLGLDAPHAGIERFTASVLASNEAPVRLARSVAPLVEVSFDAGETQLVIPLVAPRRLAGPPAARPAPARRTA